MDNLNRIISKFKNQHEQKTLRYLTSKFSSLPEEDIKDIVQESYLVLCENLVKGKVNEPSYSYFLKICINLCLKKIKERDGKVIVNIDDDGERITFVSLRHLDIDSWSESSEKNPVIKFSISLSNRVEVIGAAVRYAIGSCKGLGAYYIKDLLFPNGFPISFEEYLEQLELSLL